MQSFYYDNEPSLSNEEFDNLKEELLWAGSKVAILRFGHYAMLLLEASFIYARPITDAFACSSTEQRFMEASVAYARGKPILSDVEYDDLKAQLRKKNSKVVQQVICRYSQDASSTPAPILTNNRISSRGQGAASAAETCTATAIQTTLK